MTLTNKVFKTIINELKSENSIYNLAAMPVEIIGNTYESFLSKTIIRKGRGLSLEEKPGIKKGQGVYYTPRNIVDYIIENSLGLVLKRTKSISDIMNIKIIDISCGSGSFLIAAYEYLLNHYREYFTKQALINKKKGNALVSNDFKDKVKIYYNDNDKNNLHIRLTSKMKQEILFNNIYGVDIDSQAVEVARFSLSLKTIEDTDKSEIEDDYYFFHTSILPDLKSTIKCGNSIIDYEIINSIKNKHSKLEGFDENSFDREIEKINPFNWEQNFEFIKNGDKFDVIIGNPPWVSLTGKFGNDVISIEEQKYLTNKYSKYNINTYMPNLYEYFISKGFDFLKENGIFSLIVPDRFGFNNQFISFRKYIISNYKINNLIYKADFPNVTADTLIFSIENQKQQNEYEINTGEFSKNIISKNISDYKNDPNFIFSYETSSEVSAVLKKLSNSTTLKPIITYFDLTSGFGGKSKLITTEPISKTQMEVIKEKM